MANAKTQVLIGSQARGLKVNYPDPRTGVLIGITKTEGDTTNVTIEVTFVLTNLLGNSLISFLIQKGDLGVTAVALYNFNSERSLVASFINDGNGSTDGKNSASYSVGAGSLVAGGPLSDPFQGPSQLVWAFYYPLWGNAGGRGWTDPSFKDKPSEIGPGMSDRDCVLEHMRIAKSAGIDGFIVSWWWNKDLTQNSVLPTLLDAAAQENFKVTIYFPAVYNGSSSLPMSNQDLLRLFRGFFAKYEHDQRYFMIDGRPVIFVYAADAEPLLVWRNVFSTLTAEGHKAFYVGETAKPDYLEVFDGIHVYMPMNDLKLGTLDALYNNLQISTRSYGLLHPEKPGKLWAATLVPGYDDGLLNRGTIQIIPRNDGGTYRQTLDAALRSNPDWILITSFNEWLENSHIEPSKTYGWKYIDLTTQFSAEFKQVAFVPAIAIRKGLGSSTVSINESEKVEVRLVNTGNGSAVDLLFRETSLPSTSEFVNGTLEGKVDRLLPEETLPYEFSMKILRVGNTTLPRTEVSYKGADNQTYFIMSNIVTVLATIHTVTEAPAPAPLPILGFPLESILAGFGLGLLSVHLICRNRRAKRKHAA